MLSSDACCIGMLLFTEKPDDIVLIIGFTYQFRMADLIFPYDGGESVAKRMGKPGG
jgi:hypothetical protein